MTFRQRDAYRFSLALGIFHSHVDCSFAGGKSFDGEIRFGSNGWTGGFDTGTINANAKQNVTGKITG